MLFYAAMTFAWISDHTIGQGSSLCNSMQQSLLHRLGITLEGQESFYTILCSAAGCIGRATGDLLRAF